MAPRELYLDLETYNEEPLKNGTYKYAQTAEIILFAWAFGDDEVQVWDVASGDGMPDALYVGLSDPGVTLIAHEAAFDRTILRMQMPEFNLPIERWLCTAAQARAHSMPGGLGKLCSILKVPTAESKMPEGKDLVRLFCMPQKRKGTKTFRATPGTHPEKWQQFIDYCGLDVVAMREVRRRMPKWNYGGAGYPGRTLWHFDQLANDRGFHVDVELATAAVRTVARVKATLDARTSELTGGAVAKATQRDALLAHLLGEFGVDLPNMQSATLERRLEDENLPDEVKELIAIRLQASTASVGKYKALARSVTDDGRLHGTMLYCGAARTGRRSGRLFQPQNLSRVPKHLLKSYDQTADIIRLDAADLLLEDPMETMGYMVRAAIDAPPGKKLNVADLSNIEGRMMAWGAGEEWKLKAFREFDLDPKNTVKDLYVLSYAAAFNVSPESVARDYAEGGILRQIGKVQELACQYWGALNAFKKMAAIYGVDLGDERIREVVKLWRAANQNIMNFSGNLEKAARNAIKNPGRRYTVNNGMAVFQRDGAWLRMRLPSGRCLCYPHPEVDGEGKISYMGVDSYTRQWKRIGTYGGKFGENWTQAASADFMMENELVIEAAGYDIVLDVHDEVVTETDDTDRFSGAELGRLLATPRPWSVGLPTVAGGYSAKRYRKG